MTGTRSRGVTSFGNIFVKKNEAKKKLCFFLQTAIIEQTLVSFNLGLIKTTCDRFAGTK